MEGNMYSLGGLYWIILSSMKKTYYKTVFISDIHLWNLKNQSEKLIHFLDSICMETLIIVWDFLDYWQLAWFWKRTERETKMLNYINSLAEKWINIIYIQWNHDRYLKCSDTIRLKNISIVRDMYYSTSKWNKYYVTHWDCLDWINSNWNKLWEIWSVMYGLLLRVEWLISKRALKISHLSWAEKLDYWVKKWRMPESKIRRKITKFAKNLVCDWIIIGHFHVAKHYDINWLDYFNTGDWLKNCSAVVENSFWDLELIFYRDK